MYFLLLGVGVGLLSLLPPGPVTVTLVHVAGTSGHRAAIRGALGIATGDLVVAIAAVSILGAGAALPVGLFSGLQLASAALLLGLGLMLALRPGVADAAVARIQRPGRALFALTAFTPTVLGSWIAMLAAMPFAANSSHIALFALGVVVASLLWHPLLGLGAATVGSSITATTRRRLSRAGGVSMAVLGAWLLLAQVS